MACDICNAKGGYLEPINDIYKTDDIQDVCPDCIKIVNKQLNKIQSCHRKAQRSLLKRFMSVMKLDKEAK